MLIKAWEQNTGIQLFVWRSRSGLMGEPVEWEQRAENEECMWTLQQGHFFYLFIYFFLFQRCLDDKIVGIFEDYNFSSDIYFFWSIIWNYDLWKIIHQTPTIEFFLLVVHIQLFVTYCTDSERDDFCSVWLLFIKF